MTMTQVKIAITNTKFPTVDEIIQTSPYFDDPSVIEPKWDKNEKKIVPLTALFAE